MGEHLRWLEAGVGGGGGGGGVAGVLHHTLILEDRCYIQVQVNMMQKKGRRKEEGKEV